MCSFPISKQRKLKLFNSLNKRSALCLYFDEVSAILQALHIRALLSRSSGKIKFASSSWYVEARPLRFCGDHVRVFFFSFFFLMQTTHLQPGSRGPSSKYLRWNKPVDIKSSFSSAPYASLIRLRRQPSVSIRKKYPLEPRVHILLNHEHILQDQRAK